MQTVESMQPRSSFWARPLFAIACVATASLALACGASGLSHTVPDDAMARVTGEDQVQLQASAQGVTQAEQNFGQVESQVGAAEDAISEAKGQVSDAERELEALEDQRRALEEKVEEAKAKVEWRKEQRELAKLKAKAAEAEILVAKARHELEKFKVVGRVETGSEEKFQARLKDFQEQLTQAEKDAEAVRDTVADKERQVASMGSNF